MKKLRINLEQLQVESFATGDTLSERGTVHARVPDTDPGWCPPSQDAYCSYGHLCTYPYYTCGGWGCRTWEAIVCYRNTEGEQTCSLCET